ISSPSRDRLNFKCVSPLADNTRTDAPMVCHRKSRFLLHGPDQITAEYQRSCTPLHGPRNQAVAVVTNLDRAAPFAEEELPSSRTGRVIGSEQQPYLLHFNRLTHSDILGPPIADSE